MFPASRFWLKPFSLGVVPGMSLSERTGIHVINYVVFTTVLGATFFSILNVVQENWHLLPFNLACVGISIVGILLLWRRRGQAAVLLVCGCGGAVVALQAYRTGNGVEDGLLFLLVFAAFVIRGAWPRRLFALACAAAYVWVRLAHSQPTTIGSARYAVNVVSGLVGLYGLVAIFRAVGERYRREAEARARELEAQRRALEEANVAKERLFALVSHDLRGPVVHLKESVEHFAAGRLTPEQFDEIRGVLRADIHGLHASIENILQWASGRIASPGPRFEAIPVRAAVDEALGLLVPMAKEKGLRIGVSVPHEAAVLADGGQLQAILRNLLSNAIKFTAPAGRIGVEARRDGDAWVVVVSDSGCGKLSGASAIRRHLAGEDPAVPSWGEGKERGFGLGLRLCREFVALHGGLLGAEEEPNGGTRVWVSLPAATADMPAASSSPAVPSSVEP